MLNLMSTMSWPRCDADHEVQDFTDAGGPGPQHCVHVKPAESTPYTRFTLNRYEDETCGNSGLGSVVAPPFPST